MPTVFSRIIQGELPARFVWSDDRCVAFLSSRPLRPGHVLVVPRAEVDHWLDLSTQEWKNLSAIAQHVGQALQRAYQPEKVGMMLAGLEVPHVHIHLVPINALSDLDLSQAEADPDPVALDEAADTIRASLRELGYDQVAG
ncbi:MAG: HIT domain-containing protein [Nitriliruptorales bacterium]|nr:HIT domain-containing protein [Nitriliruptorales bacterium]